MRKKMNKTATIQTRIDPKVKNSAQKVLNKLNISMSEAISIFLTQVSLNKGIPFEIKIPNKTTEDTLRKSEKGEDLHEVSDIKQLLRELDN
jgi:DNA-damage-inducible protein J